MLITQLLPALTPHDAVSNFARALDKEFEAAGHQATIATPGDAPGAEAEAVLYHYSIDSPLTELYRRASGRRAIFYHNLTPPGWFARFQPDQAHRLFLGRQRLADLAESTRVAFANSRFSAAELAGLGFADVRAVPVVAGGLSEDTAADEFFARPYADGALNVLFVGRLAPNKRIEDLLRVLHYLRAGGPARLLLAGAANEVPAYTAALKAQARALGFGPNAVVFTGKIDDASLAALYRAARVFLCLSEHEGFGLPLVEAMRFQLPVVAFAAGAVPETLGQAGLLCKRKDYRAIAALCRLLAEEGDLRRKVIAGQATRLALLPADAAATARQILSALSL